jgi:hypothetical protein
VNRDERMEKFILRVDLTKRKDKKAGYDFIIKGNGPLNLCPMAHLKVKP